MVLIEALACGTPVIGLDSGAIPEVIKEGQTGFVVKKSGSDADTISLINNAIAQVKNIDRGACRSDFEARFTLERMCQEHLSAYKSSVGAPLKGLPKLAH